MEQMTSLPTCMSSAFGVHEDVLSSGVVQWMQDARRSMLSIAAADDTSWEHLAQEAEARYLGHVTHEHAMQRLSMTTHVDVVILDLRGAAMDLAPLNVALADLASRDGTALIILSDLKSIEADLERLDARLWADTNVYWLCDAGMDERIEAVCSALTSTRVESVLHDSGPSSHNAQLEQLSLEVQRLSRTLEEMRFPEGTSSQPATFEAERSTADPEGHRDGKKRGEHWRELSGGRRSIFASGDGTLTAAVVRDLLRARRMREQFFDGDLFADPAWDMILDLMAARLSGERVSVSSLCIAAAVPPTTALRWIRHLTQAGIFERRPDTQDGRRVFIALSDKTAAAVHRWYTMSIPMRHDDED